MNIIIVLIIDYVYKNIHIFSKKIELVKGTFQILEFKKILITKILFFI